MFLFLILVPAVSFGQGTVIVRPPKKAETKTETKVETKTEVTKPTQQKVKNNDKKNNTVAPKPSKPTRTVVSHPAIVHSQQWAVDRILKNMVRVDGGTLLMGVADASAQGATEDNLPAHEVSLSPFYICKYEVTEEEWQLIMGNNPSDKSNGMVVSLQCPVDNVSWHECQDFVSKLSELTGVAFRLPTEAEWEFAARGGETSESLYAGADDIEVCGWFVNNSSRMKHPVGQKQPNRLGLYDMTGNVREWCKDFYEKDY